MGELAPVYRCDANQPKKQVLVQVKTQLMGQSLDGFEPPADRSLSDTAHIWWSSMAHICGSFSLSLNDLT